MSAMAQCSTCEGCFGDAVLAEIVAFLPAAALACVSTCSRGALKASDVCWHAHLEHLSKVPSWQRSDIDRRAWRRSFASFSGAEARKEYNLCVGGIRQALREASPGPPTAQQVLQFVDHVRSSHSWYKHLPIEKGTFFQVGMSPTARMRFTPTGIIEYVRGDGTEFHYTWSTTAEYRERLHCFVWRQFDAPRDKTYTDNAQDGRPLLVTSMPSSFIPVTSCIYPDSNNYPLLADVYREYKSQRSAGTLEATDATNFAVGWGRHQTGRGLPSGVMADFARIYDFEVQHPPETWSEPSAVLRADALNVCRALFPHYDEVDLQLETEALLASHSRNVFREGPSCCAKRAEGARAQVSMIRGLLDWVSFVWGSEAVPSVSLSMSSLQRRDLERSSR